MERYSGTELKITEDGSHTLYATFFDECYHSSHGAIQESEHIFIRQGLLAAKKKSLNVLEIGFGTGLNAFLTLLEAQNSGINVYYTGVELFPVNVEQAMQLNYPDVISPRSKDLFQRLHAAPWGVEVELEPCFRLLKINVDFQSFVPDNGFDVIYFDAFSPEKQPEMWTEERFRLLYESCSGGAVLTTYCSKGVVRRALQAVGFRVERLPGPPGKREILRACK